MRVNGDSTGEWEPLSPQEVSSLLDTTDRPWMVAGGWAIDLFLGGRTRDHADIDVLVLRRDQGLIHPALSGWHIYAADPPGALRPWRPGETLPVGVHDIWCRQGDAAPWRLQFMIDEADGEDWVSRRDSGVRRSLADARRWSRDGIPYLAPEIQLFYKARSPRAKDESDFRHALPRMTDEQRAWLRDAIARTMPDHPWLVVIATSLRHLGEG